MAGNANSGKHKAKIYRDMLQKRLDELNALPAVVDQLISKAIEGDMQAIKEIGDRLDGKPAQAIIGDSEEDPINVSVSAREHLISAIAGIAARAAEGADNQQPDGIPS